MSHYTGAGSVGISFNTEAEGGEFAYVTTPCGERVTIAKIRKLKNGYKLRLWDWPPCTVDNIDKAQSYINQNALHLLARGRPYEDEKKQAPSRISEALSELTNDEASSVTICNDNADYDGPDSKVTCNAEWTHWEDHEITGNTRVECLELAVAAKRQAERTRIGMAV